MEGSPQRDTPTVQSDHGSGRGQGRNHQRARDSGAVPIPPGIFRGERDNPQPGRIPEIPSAYSGDGSRPLAMEDETRDILRSSLDQGAKERTLARRSTLCSSPLVVSTCRGAPRADARATDLRRMILLDTNVVSELMKSASERP
jgi:hypothetical protein